MNLARQSHILRKRLVRKYVRKALRHRRYDNDLSINHGYMLEQFNANDNVRVLARRKQIHAH